jgi:hypothetical protein
MRDGPAPATSVKRSGQKQKKWTATMREYTASLLRAGAAITLLVPFAAEAQELSAAARVHVVGTESVRRYVTVAHECGLAALAELSP